MRAWAAASMTIFLAAITPIEQAINLLEKTLLQAAPNMVPIAATMDRIRSEESGVPAQVGIDKSSTSTSPIISLTHFVDSSPLCELCQHFDNRFQPPIFSSSVCQHFDNMAP
jgi:hypothetical protein